MIRGAPGNIQKAKFELKKNRPYAKQRADHFGADRGPSCDPIAGRSLGLGPAI